MDPFDGYYSLRESKIAMFSILIVDDEPDNFDVVEALLSNTKVLLGSDEDPQLHYAASGQDALNSLDICQPDLILLDVMMPGMDGIEVCQRIKAIQRWQSVPIIIITALTNKKDLSRCLEAGADDFISKPVNRLELNARVRSMLRIHQQYQQLATFNSRLESMVQQRTVELETLIYQDALTQLPSRNFVLQEMAERSLQKNEKFAVVLLDCDQFQVVNGSFGNSVGNQLLVAIAERLSQYRGPEDILARLGEDEFCFLVDNAPSLETLIPFVEQLLESFKKPFRIGSCDIFITACMGITLTDRGKQLPEDLLQEADTAMYQAKLRGKGSYQVFDRKMHLALLKRLTLETDLQRSLDQQEFTTYYQPIVDLRTRQLAGVEALVRWHHPERGMVSPGVFIPCMEATGLIIPVGMLVLRQACYQMQRWHQQGWSHLTVSVNLSVRQFACPSLIADIDRIVEETGINPARLKFEITESAIMDNTTEAIEMTEALRSRQIEISIDDFGTGYSSLGYLHQFSIDNLKVDRSFVTQVEVPRNRRAYVVDTIIALSQQLGLSVIAEGIETPKQLEYLQNLGCEFGQGYLFDKPLSAREFADRYLKAAVSF